MDGKWEHDLFGAQSDLYSPQLNTSFGKAKRSANGGVFGKALDGISSSSLHARASTKSPPPKNPSGDLFGRFGLESPASAASPASSRPFSPSNVDGTAKEREERLRKKAEWEAQVREQDNQKRLARQQDRERELKEQAEQRRREELLRQEELELQLPRRQLEEQEQLLRQKSSQATIVVIENLVDGTTPEDVKAALGDFGEILTCTVLESNGDTVTMRLEFTNKGEAQNAVSQLNGALADGKTLRLTIQERPAAPPKPMGMNLKGTKNRQENQRNAAGPRSNGAQSAKHQNHRQAEEKPTQDVQMDIPVSQPGSKLRSDRIVVYDPRAEVVDRPSPQHLAKQNRSRQNNASNGQSNDSQVSIAQRFGFNTPQAGGPPSQPRAMGRTRHDSSGLLGRLGGSARRDDSMMDTS